MNVIGLMPTRGVVFTAVQSALDHIAVDHWIRTDRQAVPDAFNTLVEQALLFHADAFLFIEEDTVPPNTLFLEQMKNILVSNPEVGAVTVEYPVNASGFSSVVHHSETKEILYCGLGCTMVKAEVLKKMRKPWFRSDWKYVIDPKEQRGWVSCPAENQYGLYDVLFFTRMRALGYSIAQCQGVCRHLEIAGGFTPSQNGAVLKIKEKAGQIILSTLPCDPVTFWREP